MQLKMSRSGTGPRGTPHFVMAPHDEVVTGNLPLEGLGSHVDQESAVSDLSDNPTDGAQPNSPVSEISEPSENSSPNVPSTSIPGSEANIQGSLPNTEHENLPNTAENNPNPPSTSGSNSEANIQESLPHTEHENLPTTVENNPNLPSTSAPSSETNIQESVPHTGHQRLPSIPEDNEHRHHDNPVTRPSNTNANPHDNQTTTSICAAVGGFTAIHIPAGLLHESMGAGHHRNPSDTLFLSSSPPVTQTNPTTALDQLSGVSVHPSLRTIHPALRPHSYFGLPSDSQQPAAQPSTGRHSAFSYFNPYGCRQPQNDIEQGPRTSERRRSEPTDSSTTEQNAANTIRHAQEMQSSEGYALPSFTPESSVAGVHGCGENPSSTAGETLPLQVQVEREQREERNLRLRYCKMNNPLVVLVVLVVALGIVGACAAVGATVAKKSA